VAAAAAEIRVADLAQWMKKNKEEYPAKVEELQAADVVAVAVVAVAVVVVVAVTAAVAAAEAAVVNIPFRNIKGAALQLFFLFTVSTRREMKQIYGNIVV
jgi:hypothetical protein